MTTSARVDRSDFVLPKTVLFGWGLGTLAPVIILTATNVLLLRFMTDYVGIAAGVASLLIAGAKVMDAFIDPLMGVISDKTRSRWGRRRPYLMAGGLMLAAATLALFIVPPFESNQARTLYMTVALLFYAVAYTVFNIPYLAMPAEMTGSYHERSYLMSFRVYGVGLSQIAVSFGGYMLIAKLGGAAGHFAMAVCLAVIIFASSVACFTMTARAPFTVREDHVTYPISQQIRSVLSNRPFFVLILTKFLTLMSLGTQAVFPFFFSRILGIDDSYLGYYFLISSLLLICSQPLWLWLSRRFGKRTTFMFALLLSAPAWLSWLLASAGEPMLLVYLRAVIIGIAGGGAILMGQSMLPDAIEYDYRRTGLRREGIFAGFYTTVEKLSGAIGIAVVGAFLGAAGYIQSRGVTVDQPPSAIQAIYISIAVIPAAISVAAAIALIWYDLSEQRLKNTMLVDTASAN